MSSRSTRLLKPTASWGPQRGGHQGGSAAVALKVDVEKVKRPERVNWPLFRPLALQIHTPALVLQSPVSSNKRETAALLPYGARTSESRIPVRSPDTMTRE